MQYKAAIAILGLLILLCVYIIKRQQIEGFYSLQGNAYDANDVISGGLQLDYYMKDKRLMSRDTIWSTVSHINTDATMPGGGVLGTSYLAGTNALELKALLDESFSADLQRFPSKHKLNTEYEWGMTKVLPVGVSNSVIKRFMNKASLRSKHSFYIFKSRVTHAHSAQEKYYILTYQLIVHQEATMYAKVIQFTAFVDVGNRDIVFTDVKVTGVIHEQYLSPTVGALFTSSSDDHN